MDKDMQYKDTPSSAQHNEKTDLELYFNRDLFWKKIIELAVKNKPVDINDPNLEINLFTKHNELYDKQESIATQILEKMDIEIGKDLIPSSWLSLQKAQEAVLNSIGMPKKAYFVSRSNSELTKDPRDFIDLKLASGWDGEGVPGVQLSPYIQDPTYIYTGEEASDMLIAYEVEPDENCRAYVAINNFSAPFFPIQISTNGRDCGDFKEAILMDIEESSLPIVDKADKDKLSYKKILLVTGGKILENK